MIYYGIEGKETINECSFVPKTMKELLAHFDDCASCLSIIEGTYNTTVTAVVTDNTERSY
jgi:hypothetical protein